MPQPPASSARGTTMVDVARAVGVSQTTVSAVINQRPGIQISEQTRQRVLQAAADMNYRPNRAAQALRANQTYLVGIITNGIVAGPYAGRIVAGIQKAVHAAGQLCLVVDATDYPSEGDDAVTNFLAQGVTGIIYASFAPVEIHTSSSLADTRRVFVNCWPVKRGGDETVILADEYGGGKAAAAAAFELGHTRVAFVGGLWDEYASVERRRGFQDAARDAGLDPDSLYQAHGDYQITSGYKLTLEAMKTANPTALVCGNDKMAVGAVLALQKLGLEAPRDVSVIGYDDQLDIANEMQPPLTTVSLPYLEMGHRAGTLLLHGLDPTSSALPIASPLIQRDSLGPPPSS